MDKQTLQVKEMDTIYFILDVLKQHEQEFNRLITKLSEVSEQLRETEKVIDRIDEIDERLKTLNAELSMFLKSLFCSAQ